MSFVEVTAEKTNDAVLESYSLTTESKPRDGSDTLEDFRAVLRVVISNEAQNVSAVSQPTATLAIANTLNVRFNRDALVTIYPLVNSDGSTETVFKLVSQEYTPYDVKGSTFFRGVLEYVSVTEWESLSWA